MHGRRSGSVGIHLLHRLHGGGHGELEAEEIFIKETVTSLMLADLLFPKLRFCRLFDPWIRDLDKVSSGSRIPDPNPIFRRAKLQEIFSATVEKENYFSICHICGYKKTEQQIFFNSSVVAKFLDPRSRIRDG
jgi:hypothetical protein